MAVLNLSIINTQVRIIYFVSLLNTNSIFIKDEIYPTPIYYTNCIM